jgi:hypothetical protein
MFSVFTREHSSKFVNRLTAAASSRFQVAVNPTLVNTAFFSDTAYALKPKPKHIKKSKHISPGTLGLVVDPARVEAKKMRREIDAIFNM